MFIFQLKIFLKIKSPILITLVGFEKKNFKVTCKYNHAIEKNNKI